MVLTAITIMKMMTTDNIFKAQ